MVRAVPVEIRVPLTFCRLSVSRENDAPPNFGSRYSAGLARERAWEFPGSGVSTIPFQSPETDGAPPRPPRRGRRGREMVVRELGREALRVSEKIAPRTDKYHHGYPFIFTFY
jgi:hypothetical protein